MIVTRSEKHKIKENNPYYKMLDDFCFRAKNLYNHALYLVRQEYIKNRKWLRYLELEQIIKSDLEHPDYAKIPGAKSAQRVLMDVDENFSSYFAALRSWKKNPNKFPGKAKPGLPNYKKKNGRFTLRLTNQGAKYRKGVIKFPKIYKGFTIIPSFKCSGKFVDLQQVWIVPRNKCFIVELVYRVEIESNPVLNDRCLGIDLGVNNLAAIANNIGEKPLIIDGRGIKSVNQWYNKQERHYRSVDVSIKGNFRIPYSKRLCSIVEKRNDTIEDYMHKVSRYIVNYASSLNIGTIIIGKDLMWKDGVNIGHRNNQMFVEIPHANLIDKIIYKANDVGIRVITTEESFTSGTSFLDNELPVESNYNISRRKKRGLFISNKGFRINADVNAAFQMIKKVFPNAFGQWNSGCAYHPVKVTVR